MGFDPKFLNYCEETNSSPILGKIEILSNYLTYI